MTAVRKPFDAAAGVGGGEPQQVSRPEKSEWNHRILIVEDETAIADAYRDILASPSSNILPFRRSSRSQGGGATPPPTETRLPTAFELVVVSSADKALAEVKHAVKIGKPFTMGFFDVMLGEGMDGIELVKAVQEVDPDIHAVFVTAYSDRSVDSIQGLLGENQADRWDYLNKPFTKGEILQKARNAVTYWNLCAEKRMSAERLENAQKQLLEYERFASVAAVARGIGHEFRNILTLITGKAELGSDSQNSAIMNDSLKSICTASYRAAEILERFNYLCAPSQTRQKKRWLNLHEPVEEALALMSHQLKAGQIKVCWVRKRSVQAFANPTSLLQVVVNVLINSTHAMGNSGQIDVSVTEVEGRGEIRIRDYGPGIDKEIINRVTEAFYTTKGDKGTGLGLAIVKEIIESEHDGTLRIENHQVRGLEVIILLPLDEPKEESVG